jgi:hypothetical protein
VVDGIECRTRPFPQPLEPSDLIKGHVKAGKIDVADCFTRAMRYVAGKCATHPPCNAYARGLGGGLTLEDLFGWEITFWF